MGSLPFSKDPSRPLSPFPLGFDQTPSPVQRGFRISGHDNYSFVSRDLRPNQATCSCFDIFLLCWTMTNSNVLLYYVVYLCNILAFQRAAKMESQTLHLTQSRPIFPPYLSVPFRYLLEFTSGALSTSSMCSWRITSFLTEISQGFPLLTFYTPHTPESGGDWVFFCLTSNASYKPLLLPAKSTLPKLTYALIPTSYPPYCNHLLYASPPIH